MSEATGQPGNQRESFRPQSRPAAALAAQKSFYLNVATANYTEATLTGLPSGKTVKVFIIAANDAGQAAPSDPAEVVVL